MYTFESRIRFSETDENEEISLAAIMNYLQDCSSFEAEDLGVGAAWLRARDRAWVLNSWQIVIKRRPKVYERIVIGTQPYAFRGALGMRNFSIKSADGEECIIANSVWCLVQISKMIPAALGGEHSSAYTLGKPLDMEYAGRKLNPPQNPERKAPIVVSHEYIDCNHHVNNSRYVILAEQFLPKGFKLCQIRAQYKSQAHLGDIMIPEVETRPSCVVTAFRRQDGSDYAIVEFCGKDA